MTRIIGIVLVRNEDLFVRQAVESVLGFCDRVILADNGSTDGTAEILQALVREQPEKLEYHRISHPRFSHDLLKEFIGTDTWVFGVDGDEIYDRERLPAFRTRLLSGEFRAAWMILGNVLHCVSADSKSAKAAGYLAPPSRSITKLYNFSAIDGWDGDTVERLHGGNIRFRAGYGHGSKRSLQDEQSWEDSSLRCLHLCFLRRSSAEPESPAVRENIMELHKGSLSDRIRRGVNRLFGWQNHSSWKREYYRRGPLVEVGAASFFGG